MSYSDKAYQAALDTLVHTVEVSILERDDYGFSSALLGPTIKSHLNRRKAVIDAFYKNLAADEKAEVVMESFEPSEEFIESPMFFISEYLLPVITERLDEMTWQWLADQDENYKCHMADSRENAA